ncbi:MAG TPA: error-prone DNA polymerase [Terriglobales bacterium]|nr:error-prone DNA polymerase [Terriglobales bacterium]
MYIELHARSAFSFLEGTSLPEDLVDACAALQMPAMAVLDRDGVYGAPRFHMAAVKAGIQAHIGAEIHCSPFNHSILKAVPSSRDQKHVYARRRQKKAEDTKNRKPSGPAFLRDEFRIPLLAANRDGYQNLCRLITKMKLRAAKEEGSVCESELEEHAAGLICLTGGNDGPLAAAYARGGTQEAFRSVLRLVEIFGRANVYVELQRHFHREEEVRNRVAVEIARALDLPLLATNGVSYATPRERELCDVFTALRNHESLATAGRLLAQNSERHLKTAEQMQELFADLPEAISHTKELSARLQFKLDDLGYEFPKYPVPEGETMMSFLRERTREGFQRRYGRADHDLKSRARRQIERELALIEKLDLSGYFLIVWDIVRFCREQNILAQGRGSAANSAVCYSLGITAVDPVGMDLLFERFLSEERGEWPDIDIDLPSGDQRERAIQYVYQRYGDRGAAMTANVITYRNRMAAREMGKALGFDPETLDRISAAVATFEFKDAQDALDRRFQDAGLDLRHPRLRKYFELCMATLDLPRHLGQHSGGMVICQGQLDSVVPLEPASMPGRVVVQWDKEDCSDMKIIKVDLLGLGMIAVLEDSIRLIREDYKEEVDLAHLPQDDPAVYFTLQKADTVGMFQIESRAQMSCLPRLRPQHFYDIVVQVAIIRPGPIVGQMVNPFLKRRQGREEVVYPHPSLEPVLERTLGVPLFQEQLLRMAMVVANFTGGEAEELRRAMGFKRSEKRMREIETKLRAGMRKNGISPEAEEQIVLSITSFALYGFPESHAASFALIAYASAYLKCHYLAAFTAALLNNQPMGFYHPSTIVKDAQRHGLKVLPIDVTKSEWNCTLERSDGSAQDSAQSCQPSALGDQDATGLSHDERANSLALRLGLRYVRGLHEEAGKALLRERNRAPFISTHDLARRVPELRKDELTTLAAIGALNSINDPAESHPGRAEQVSGHDSLFEPRSIHHHPSSIHAFPNFHRRDALWEVERAVRFSGPLLEQAAEVDSRSPLALMTHEERLVADFRGTGLTVGPHPMAYRRAEMNKLGIRRACDLAAIPNGKLVRIGGCVIARQRPGTARGFVFLSIEDETGIANAIITPDLLQENRILVISERFLLVEGTLQNQDNVISVKADRVSALAVTSAETSSHDFH